MTEFDYCIDVNESPLYNRIVDSRNVGQPAVAQSTEPMRRDLHANGDQRYKLGFVIEHNPKHAATRGSCIFAHLWGSSGQTTAGCTAMDDAAMRGLMAWLDAKKQPVFVLLPQAEYERLKTSWRLPDIAQAR
jgi:L,D-peptidoglycan transpeptidase YkuD (ErfK/YbiS/YcfS/YnhG family)